MNSRRTGSFPDLDSDATTKVCRVCLAMSVKMYHILEFRLCVMYERVTGVQIKAGDNLPKMLCWECVARLSSANHFIEKSLKTNEILVAKVNSSPFVTISDIESIDRALYQLESTLSFKSCRENDYYYIKNESDTSNDLYSNEYYNYYDGDDIVIKSEEVQNSNTEDNITIEGNPIKREYLDDTEEQMLADENCKKANISDERVDNLNNVKIQVAESNDESVRMKQPRKKRKNDDYRKKPTLGPRDNPHKLAPNTTDSSFMDTTDNMKNRDETYGPVTDNNTANVSYTSDSLGEVSSCTRDLTYGSILLGVNTNETHLVDQVVTSRETKHILVENSDNSSESQESYITKNHTVTSQSFLPSKTIVPPINQESIDTYVCKNHNVTSQSLSPSQTSNPSMRDVPTTSSYTDNPKSYDSHYSENSEIDDSNQDETYNPASTNEVESNTDCLEESGTNESEKKIKRIRIKNYCFYCETDVLNFARHIERDHAMECEVQKILSNPKKSFTRLNLLANLRKKGNYIKNVSKCCKPVKRSSIHPDVDYLPCQNCLGFYSSKHLWKHKKKCLPLSETANTQVGAQNFMLRYLKIDPNLKEIVFSKMKPDKISLEAKKDPLICAFAARFLRIHPEKHYINLISRKMRELSKLLTELKKLKPSITDLLDSLKPQNYDLIVTATKIVSSYDHETDRYGAPTYAINISTSLKQCCNIAAMTTLTSDSSVKPAVIEADLKALIHRIESDWKFDVSNQAYSDMNFKKSNKITIDPLASDMNEDSNKSTITEDLQVRSSKTTRRGTRNATKTIAKKKRTLVPWTTQQKNIVMKFFSKHIKNKQFPKRHECDELRNLYPEVLENKDWLEIKVYVQNAYTKGNK